VSKHQEKQASPIPDVELKEGGPDKVRVLILDNDPRMVALIEQTMDEASLATRFEHIDVPTSKEARDWMDQERFDMLVWCGYGVPRNRQTEYQDASNSESVCITFGRHQQLNPNMRRIAIVPDDTGNYIKMVCGPLIDKSPFHAEVMAPPDLDDTGKFREDLTRAVQEQLRNVRNTN